MQIDKVEVFILIAAKIEERDGRFDRLAVDKVVGQILMRCFVFHHRCLLGDKRCLLLLIGAHFPLAQY